MNKRAKKSHVSLLSTLSGKSRILWMSTKSMLLHKKTESYKYW